MCLYFVSFDRFRFVNKTFDISSSFWKLLCSHSLMTVIFVFSTNHPTNCIDFFISFHSSSYSFFFLSFSACNCIVKDWMEFVKSEFRRNGLVSLVFFFFFCLVDLNLSFHSSMVGRHINNGESSYSHNSVTNVILPPPLPLPLPPTGPSIGRTPWRVSLKKIPSLDTVTVIYQSTMTKHWVTAASQE